MTELLTLGTYTRDKSQGIYTVSLDTQNDTLKDLTLLTEAGNPTYLAKKDHTLISVLTNGDQGGIASWDLENQSCFLINSVMKNGAAPCYVSIDSERQLTYSANYHTGEITVYQLSLAGQLEQVESLTYAGSGPHPNQATSHAHFADLTPDNRLVTCDLGGDTVYTYDVSPEGKLTEVTSFNAPAGSGPRHLTFHPNKTTAYLFGELDSTVTTLNYDVLTGAFSQNQTYSTLPKDFTGESSGAAIQISQDGRFLYLSNRGHNSIVTFEISADDPNTLTPIQWISTEGDGPRDFTLNKTEDYLIVGHQFTNNLTLFKRSKDTGLLTLVQKDFEAPECVCIV